MSRGRFGPVTYHHAEPPTPYHQGVQTAALTRIFSHQYQALWQDMDAKRPMSTSAYLQYATNTRFLFLETVGFTPAPFAERHLGPVVLEDRLTYRREISMLQTFTVEYQATAGTSDGRRFKVRSAFSTDSQGVHAIVDSIGQWFDLDTRRPVAPPADLQAAFAQLARSDDDEHWDTPPTEHSPARQRPGPCTVAQPQASHPHAHADAVGDGQALRTAAADSSPSSLIDS